MQGLPNDIESSNICRSGPEGRNLLSSLLNKLSDTCLHWERPDPGHRQRSREAGVLIVRLGITQI
jgi:hypothetical protein